MMGNEIVKLIQQCLILDISVKIVRCGQYAKPGKPYLCRVMRGIGTAKRDYLVYGDDSEAIMREEMQHVLKKGFTQKQDRYGLG